MLNFSLTDNEYETGNGGCAQLCVHDQFIQLLMHRYRNQELCYSTPLFLYSISSHRHQNQAKRCSWVAKFTYPLPKFLTAMPSDDGYILDAGCRDDLWVDIQNQLRRLLGQFSTWNQLYMHVDIHVDKIILTSWMVLATGHWGGFANKSKCSWSYNCTCLLVQRGFVEIIKVNWPASYKFLTLQAKISKTCWILPDHFPPPHVLAQWNICWVILPALWNIKFILPWRYREEGRGARHQDDTNLVWKFPHS